MVIRYAPDPAGRVPPDLVGEFRGREGFHRAWDAWLEAFEDLRLEPEDVVDLGDDRLLIGLHSIGRGTGSGVRADVRGFTLYRFRAGRVVEHEFFFDRDQAEEAAGLGEAAVAGRPCEATSDPAARYPDSAATFPAFTAATRAA